jgi:hypothetical protein
MGNKLALWNHEQLGMELQAGVDEVSLALVADAWSRTYRSRAVMFARTGDALRSRNGILIVPDEVVADWPPRRRLSPPGNLQPAVALDESLGAIAARYGKRTADSVAMQLEYPR